VLSALFAGSTIFDKVLFAFIAIGAAFGPLLVVILWRGPVSTGRSLIAILTGFISAAAFFFITDIGGLAVKGTWIEKVLPYLLSMAVVLWPERRNPA
ncbi:MAG: hypothetical protein ACYTG5_20285, partial [Planctomycetota bacterium]